MRILIINTVPTERNGITNVIFNLHRAMDKGDMTFDYLSINGPDPVYTRQIEAAGGRCFVLPRSLKGLCAYVAALHKIIRQGGYDVVHAHGNSATLVLEMLAAKLAGCPVRMAHSHNTTCLSPVLHKLMNPLFQACCTHPVACGDAAGRWLFGRREFTVVNNGVDTASFGFCPADRETLRQQCRIPQSRVMLGHVGSLDERKNQMFLLDVLAMLCPSGDYGLMLMGDGPMDGALKERAEALGLKDRVIFTGAVDTVAAHLSACDLGVLPSLYEGLPLSLMEQQANGLGCLVADTVTREADQTGNLRFLPLEPSVWASEILKTTLPEDRQAMSRQAAARLAAGGYDINREAARLREFYRRAAGVN